ncbi:hypothetical protein ACHAQJ_010509 [Trichoderma viride]
MATLSATGRYKRNRHSSSISKEAGLRNEARIKVKALGAPCDYQRLKKFNAQQALENPDWRTRPSDNSSSAVDDDDHNIRELISAGRQWIRMDAAPSTTPSAVESKREAELQQAMDSPQVNATANSGLGRNQHDVFALSSKMEPKIIKALEEERPVQYEVLKKICLSSSREHPLSLFEVAPLGSIPAYLSQSLVDIRPLMGYLTQRKHGISGNGQDEQLTAALRAAETTPHKVRAHLSQQNHHEEAHKSYAISDELRARKSFFESHEMPATQRRRVHAHTIEQQISSTQTNRLVNSGGPMAGAEAERDEAFQRFLKRLGRKNRNSQEEKAQGRNRVDSGYEDSSKESQRESPLEMSSLRHRAQRVDGRKKIPSELCNDDHARGTEVSHEKEGISNPTISSVFPRESAKFKNLNPKAREFLSFVSNRGSSSDEGSMEPFQALSAESFTSKGGRTNATSLAGHALPNASSLQPPPPYGIMPFAAADGATDPLTLNSLMAGRLVSVPTDQFGGTLPTSAMPWPPLPPLPSFLPAMLRPQPVLQPMTGNALGLPAAPPLTNTAFRLPTGPVNPCMSMPSCQMPLMGGAPCLPQPVQKPRHPDPRDQQAYEAWIEWRKANEPGYALECRLRQQRRAQRSMTDKAATKALPGYKSEASVST